MIKHCKFDKMNFFFCVWRWGIHFYLKDFKCYWFNKISIIKREAYKCTYIHALMMSVDSHDLSCKYFSQNIHLEANITETAINVLHFPLFFVFSAASEVHLNPITAPRTFLPESGDGQEVDYQAVLNSCTTARQEMELFVRRLYAHF